MRKPMDFLELNIALTYVRSDLLFLESVYRSYCEMGALSWYGLLMVRFTMGIPHNEKELFDFSSKEYIGAWKE